MMGRTYLLSGTTFANPRERKGYPSEQKAAMIWSEFEHWLCVEMSERYHRDIHRGLGATPLGAWEHDMARGIALDIPADPKRFRVSFLPIEKRILQRSGLQLFSLRFCSDALPTMVRQNEPLVVRYDPRDHSKIYIKAPDLSYLEYPMPTSDYHPYRCGNCGQPAAFWHSEVTSGSTRSVCSGRMRSCHASSRKP